MCYRGVKPTDYVFIHVDKDQLQKFLSLNEERKDRFSPSKYHAQRGTILDCHSLVWGIDEKFEEEYIIDYKLLRNEISSNVRTAWKDKYTTSLYSVHNSDTNFWRYELQPIPDHFRWIRTGELHYVPLEEQQLLLGPWNDIPAAFLPSWVLDLCLSII